MSRIYSRKKINKLSKHLNIDVESLRLLLDTSNCIDLATTFDDLVRIYSSTGLDEHSKLLALTKALEKATTFDNFIWIYSRTPLGSNLV